MSSAKNAKKIVVACDSFKGSMDAVTACGIIAEVIRKLRDDCEVVEHPMADGGEGTADILVKGGGGEWVPCEVMGPLPDMVVDAGFGWIDEGKIAIVEMAKASGIELLKKDELNPMETTTFGAGELIEAAICKGAEKILLTVGSSATVDGGVGAAMAMGYEFLDANGKDVGLGGKGLGEIAKIIPPANKQWPAIDVLCDTESFLLGEAGAAFTFGPQKGASAEMVTLLEDGMRNLVSKVKECVGKDMDVARGGAAGGLSGGAYALFGAKLVSGIEAVMEFTGFEQVIKNADVVITGEGKFDETSLDGKAVSGVVAAAKKQEVSTVVIAGQVCLSPEEYEQAGISKAIELKDSEMDTDYAIEHGQELLRSRAKELSV